MSGDCAESPLRTGGRRSAYGLRRRETAAIRWYRGRMQRVRAVPRAPGRARPAEG